MIRDSYRLAFGDLRDPRFRQTALIGAALSLALLFALYALLIQLFSTFDEEVFTFSDGTRMDRLGNFFSTVSLATMMLMSIFLMAPVASLFTGLHLHAVTDSVEARHYPRLAAPRPQTTQKLWLDSVNYFGMVFFINIVAFIGITLFGMIWGIALFWALNGWLLSREYTTMISERRADATAIKAFNRAHRRQLLLAGIVLAILLSVPFLNLLMPVIGVAAFTHLIHALTATQPQGAPS
ncbi:MAG: EI24 domain-containing protein [Natronohydrobacter sp.]|nr:EI24 domain-containing protein [Natronohydrobacter sp.]